MFPYQRTMPAFACMVGAALPAGKERSQGDLDALVSNKHTSIGVIHGGMCKLKRALEELMLWLPEPHPLQ